MNRRYRLLKKNERPDRRKGDQGQDMGNGLWILVSYHGEYTVSELSPVIYRRPKKLTDADLHEHTACCS